VIQVQITALKNLAAVLAGIGVPLKNIVAGEFDFLFRQPIKNQQQNHPRNPDFETNRQNTFCLRLFSRKIRPFPEIEGVEITVLIIAHHLGMPLKQQSQSTPDRAYIDRLPKAVEHEHLLAEESAHTTTCLA
jgi:hypothetical protein